MPGRDEREAWLAFKEPIQRVVGCVDMSARLSERLLEKGRRLLASQVGGVKFGPDLLLMFSFQIEPVLTDGNYRMTTRRYDFTLVRTYSPDHIVFGWHWHPASRRSPVSYPHVHVPAASQFKTRHIPTGRMSLEDVILFGFADLGVEPAHPDAQQIVTEIRTRHKQYRTWN